MRAFLDSNILVYAFSTDDRAERARGLLPGGIVGVQCLNEFTNVALRKQRMSWTEVRAALDEISELSEIVAPIDIELHRSGLDIAERYRFRVYDGLIIAAALGSECDTLWTEDLQNEISIGNLTIRDPFR